MPQARSRQTSLLLTMAAVLLALLAVSPVAVAAEGENLPPVVSNGSVGPTSLPYLGGEVTISVDVADDHDEIARVFAQVFGWDTSYQYVALTPTGGDTYAGSVVIPPNYTDSPVSYWIIVNAQDTNGVLSEDNTTEISVEAQPQFDEAPVVSDPSVEPRELAATGGTVTIGITATDNRGIVEALAVVALPGGGTAAVTLEPISFSRFEGTFAVPPNRSTTPQQYAIEILAYDEGAQSDMADGGTVTVAASRCPPRMPAWAASKARCGRAPARIG
jgi:hypothetical protein